MRAPTPQDFLEVFAVEPVLARADEGLWAYEFVDSQGTLLRFSYHLQERSIQVLVHAHGEELVRVSQEGAKFLSISGGGAAAALLRARFEFADAHADLEVHVSPRIRIHWATLVDQR